MSKIRVAIVDDSAFVRASLRRIIEADGRFEIAWEAGDGAQALAMLDRVRPDVATMDYNMPGEPGDVVVGKMVARYALPIVMVSAHTTEGAEATLRALRAGAIDVVGKPSGEVSFDLPKIAAELLQKLIVAAGARLGVANDAPPAHRATVITPVPQSRSSIVPVSESIADRIVIIGASTGGPAALEIVVPALPHLHGYAVIVVQHMATRALTSALAHALDGRGPLHAREAVEGDRPRAGWLLVAPGGQHLSLVAAGAVHLSDAPPVHGVRPAVDVAMRSAAASIGARAIGVLLTGMGRDGALGLAALRAAGAHTIAQDEATSVVFGMPRAAIELGVVDEVAPIGAIAASIRRALEG